MPLLTLVKRLTVLLSLVLLVGAASARADGPPAPGDGGQPVAAVPGPPGSAVPTVPVPAVPVPAVPAATVPAATVPVPTVPVPASTAPVPPTPVGTTTTTPTVAPPTSTPATPPPPAPPTPAPAATVPASSAPAPAAIPTPISPVQAPAPGAAASNTTTQTITQVQVSPCASHCAGANQVQEASQDNTTVQATTPAPTPVAAPAAQTRTTPSHPTQVQVGCLKACHGTTTLDTSGMSLGQIEQLLGQLALPSPPPLTAAPGALQNVTQQSSAQSQGGAGGSADQSQVAVQSNTTVQVAASPSDGAGPAVVNQTGQGIWQVQVGCLFDCTGTAQLQQATQSNTTVQAAGGAPVVDAATQLIWQLQIGCLFRCYDAVESQGASATGSVTVVPPGASVQPPLGPPSDGAAPPAPARDAAPAPADSPAPAAPLGDAAPTPANVPDPTLPASPVRAAGAPATGGTRGSALGAGLVVEEPGRGDPGFEAVGVASGSVAATARRGQTLVSVSATRSLALQDSRPVTRSSRRRGHHASVARQTHRPGPTAAAPARTGGVTPSTSPELWLALVLAAAAALGLGAALRRLRGAR